MLHDYSVKPEIEQPIVFLIEQPIIIMSHSFIVIGVIVHDVQIQIN